MTFPNMPSFFAGGRAYAGDLELMARRIDQLLVAQPLGRGEDGSVVDGTTTSTTFTNSLTTSGIRGFTFTAPSSGNIMVSGQATARNSAAVNFVLMDFEVRQGNVIGSGTVQRAAQEFTAGAPQSDSAGQQINITCQGGVVGLTPGNVYNVALVYRVLANTGTWNRRTIAGWSVA